MGAAAENLDFGERNADFRVACEIAPQRRARVRRGGMEHRHRHRDDRVRTEPRLVRRAVEVTKRGVDRRLLARVHPGDRIRDLRPDPGDRAIDAKAPERFAAVAQIDCLMRAARGARRRDRTSDRTRFEHDLGLDGGPAARIPKLAASDGGDTRGHANFLFQLATSASIGDGARMSARA